MDLLLSSSGLIFLLTEIHEAPQGYRSISWFAGSCVNVAAVVAAPPAGRSELDELQEEVLRRAREEEQQRQQEKEREAALGFNPRPSKYLDLDQLQIQGTHTHTHT